MAKILKIFKSIHLASAQDLNILINKKTALLLLLPDIGTKDCCVALWKNKLLDILVLTALDICEFRFITWTCRELVKKRWAKHLVLHTLQIKPSVSTLLKKLCSYTVKFKHQTNKLWWIIVCDAHTRFDTLINKFAPCNLIRVHFWAETL